MSTLSWICAPCQGIPLAAQVLAELILTVQTDGSLENNTHKDWQSLKSNWGFPQGSEVLRVWTAAIGGDYRSDVITTGNWD